MAILAQLQAVHLLAEVVGGRSAPVDDKHDTFLSNRALRLCLRWFGGSATEGPGPIQRKLGKNSTGIAEDTAVAVSPVPDPVIG